MKLGNGWYRYHAASTGNPFVVNASNICAITFQDGGAGIHLNDCNSTDELGTSACYTTDEDFEEVVREITKNKRPIAKSI